MTHGGEDPRYDDIDAVANGDYERGDLERDADLDTYDTYDEDGWTAQEKVDMMRARSMPLNITFN